MLGFTIISKKRLQQLEELQLVVENQKSAFNRLQEKYDSLEKRALVRGKNGQFTKIL